MKTGNSILAVFFYYMAFTLPLNILEYFNTTSISEYVNIYDLLTGLFILFITIGTLCVITGKEKYQMVTIRFPQEEKPSVESQGATDFEVIDEDEPIPDNTEKEIKPEINTISADDKYHQDIINHIDSMLEEKTKKKFPPKDHDNSNNMFA